MATVTPAELAAQLWGRAEADSHSQGARKIRAIARAAFPHEEWTHWHLTPDEVAEIKRRL